MASDADYLKLLSWAAHGEAFGEALFSVMASETADARQRDTLELLATLERHVADRLAPLLHEAGLSDPRLAAEEQEKTAALARDLVKNGWPEFMSTFGPETARTLDRYARLRELSPDADAPELLLLVRHEQALARFAEHELTGAHELARTAITDVLDPRAT